VDLQHVLCIDPQDARRLAADPANQPAKGGQTENEPSAGPGIAPKTEMPVLSPQNKTGPDMAFAFALVMYWSKSGGF
jgi:hypothetical protein